MFYGSIQLQKILGLAKQLSTLGLSEHMRAQFTYPKLGLPVCSRPCNRRPGVENLKKSGFKTCMLPCRCVGVSEPFRRICPLFCLIL